MTWRLYDVINGGWYDEELYDTREACVAAAEHYMRGARSEGEVLQLVPEPLEPTEAQRSLMEEDEES